MAHTHAHPHAHKPTHTRTHTQRTHTSTHTHTVLLVGQSILDCDLAPSVSISITMLFAVENPAHYELAIPQTAKGEKNCKIIDGEDTIRSSERYQWGCEESNDPHWWRYGSATFSPLCFCHWADQLRFWCWGECPPLPRARTDWCKLEGKTIELNILTINLIFNGRA